ncbi:Transporter of the ATP-binding cassette (ABC), partial [Coemansia sp. RSA 2599]
VKQSALNDERITAISEMFQGIRAIKLFGWESQFIKRIEEYREKQLASRWAVVKVWIQTNAVAILTPNLILVAIFFVYVAVLGNQLTAAVAFTSISVLLTLRTSFERLPSQFSNMVSLYVSLMRVEDYLNQPEVQSLENRILLDLSAPI